MTTEYLLNQEISWVLAALTPANRLACEVMLHTGLRISDVLSLKTKDLSSRMWVKESKTGKRKQIGFPKELLRRLKMQAGRMWVFQGRKSWKAHRTRQAVWHDVKRASRAFRLPQNVGTHSMRKVYAVELMNKYGNIDRVRRALNHDSVIVTSIYAMADMLLEQKYRGFKSKGGKNREYM